MEIKYYHKIVECFHCKKEFEQRKDTIKRQLDKYGYSCCKNCFGKEQSFKEARSIAMLNYNPFKGKIHSDLSIAKIANSRIGKASWNKGLDISDVRVYRNAINTKKAKSRISISGDKNPNWKGGSLRMTTKHELISLWFPFRKQIIKRDNNSCKKCESNIKLEVHHIMSKSKYPHLKYDVHNCITLCKKCHSKFHHNFGTIKFTKNNFIEFIGNYPKI